ncbi:IPT/TIG domain-containing protein [Nonomuraea sp. NPDC003214]
MTLYAANGTQLTKTTAAAKVDDVPVTDPIVEVTEDLIEGFRPEGTTFPPQARRLWKTAGTLIRQSELDAMFPAGEITSVSPATGPAAGGTAITIKGRNFTPTASASAVTVGGANATDIVVVDEQTITCKTPAGTAGAQDVVVTTDAGAVTKVDVFTYTA